MQADGGRTIERRNGTRAATTFRKLPSARPGAKTNAARAKSTSFVSAGPVPELRDARVDAGRAGVARPRSLRPVGRDRREVIMAREGGPDLATY
jgi:hypothetical protein